MDAVEALYLLRRLGLSLEVNGGRLDVSPADLLDDDAVWLIRSHKAAIIAELQNDSPAWAWLVNHGTHSVETYHHPERTRHQVLLAYPGAVSVERLPESMYPHADHAEVTRQYPTATDLEPIPEPPRRVLSPSGLWYFCPAE